MSAEDPCKCGHDRELHDPVCHCECAEYIPSTTPRDNEGAHGMTLIEDLDATSDFLDKLKAAPDGLVRLTNQDGSRMAARLRAAAARVRSLWQRCYAGMGKPAAGLTAGDYERCITVLLEINGGPLRDSEPR